jgi:hypothetical protein
MKKLLILAIALTLCLVAVCIYYVLSAAKTPVLILSPISETEDQIQTCTLYPLCIERASIGIGFSRAAAMPGPTDTPGPSPTPLPTRTPRPSPTSCPCGSCYIGRGTYGCCPCPTVTPMPVATTTAIPTVAPPSPAPGLHGPGDGDDFEPNDEILLMWDTTILAEDEWYEVQLWKEGEPPKVVQWVKEGTWKVERSYYPGRYQWRIRIVRGQEGRKERDLSPPSQTWSFSWLSPVVQTPTAPTSTPDTKETVDLDLTVYLRDTNNAQGFATFPGEEHVDAGTIYAEGGDVYGDVAVRIGDTVYHFDKEPAPGEPEQLPDPWRVEFEFSDSLIAATEGIQPGFNPKKAQFWVGTLNCNSAVSEPYRIEMTLYAGGEARKHTEISFLVSDNPLCGSEEPDECDDPCPVRP